MCDRLKQIDDETSECHIHAVLPFSVRRPAVRLVGRPFVPLQLDGGKTSRQGRQEVAIEVLSEAARQLDEYFGGGRRQFDVPLLFAGTQFQRKVWHALLEIPYGETISYGEMACSLGVPQSVRAVANANGANAISIFAPCHRVIGSKGMLTGYGGGLDAKRYLLDLEKQLTQLD